MKTANELNLKVKGYRLLTLEEANKFFEQLIGITDSCTRWWLADISPLNDTEIACSEGASPNGSRVYEKRDRANVYLRPVLDVEGGEIKSGDEFVYKGYVFTALDETTAISRNFLGMAKYYDTQLAKLWYYHEEPVPPTNTIYEVMDILLG